MVAHAESTNANNNEKYFMEFLSLFKYQNH